MDFHSLCRRDLQTLCKMNKIPANMTNVAMADALKSLEMVEGVEEFLKQSKSISAQSSIESPEKLEITSPAIPDTGRRTSTRRTTRRRIIGDVEEAKNDPETPAPARSSRRRVPKEETSMQRAHGTRRSSRLAEKKTVAESNTKISSFSNEMPNDFQANLTEGLNEAYGESVMPGLHLHTISEGVERTDDPKILLGQKIDMISDVRIDGENSRISEEVSGVFDESEVVSDSDKNIPEQDDIIIKGNREEDKCGVDSEKELEVLHNDGCDEKDDHQDISLEPRMETDVFEENVGGFANDTDACNENGEDVMNADNSSVILEDSVSTEINDEIRKVGLFSCKTDLVNWDDVGTAMNFDNPATSDVVDEFDDFDVGGFFIDTDTLSENKEEGLNAANNNVTLGDYVTTAINDNGVVEGKVSCLPCQTENGEDLESVMMKSDNSTSSNVLQDLTAADQEQHTDKTSIIDSATDAELYLVEGVKSILVAAEDNTTIEGREPKASEYYKSEKSMEDDNEDTSLKHLDAKISTNHRPSEIVLSLDELLTQVSETLVAVDSSNPVGPNEAPLKEIPATLDEQRSISEVVGGGTGAGMKEKTLSKKTPLKKKSSTSKTPIKGANYVSDDKENIDSISGRKLLVISDRGLKPKAGIAEDDGNKLNSLHETSLRQLTKMLKEKLQITNINNDNSEENKEEEPKTRRRPALQIVPDNRMGTGEQLKEY